VEIDTKKRIILFDDRDPKFPIQAFFNTISNGDFLIVVSSLVKRAGYCINAACCSFPGDLDPMDETFMGVKFSLFEDEVIIDEQSFLYYLSMACSSYLEFNPSDKDRLSGLLRAFANS
jgi:hypothetical protein